ncbi:permease [Vibrio vulnificus]|uniref:permease n=1 Tax=Vibrio vulnificus TaxID=672 RepID=UPI003242B9A1
MKHVLNLVALAVILLGVAILEINDNQWGIAVISVSVVFWLMPLLRLVHKNAVVMVVFWSGVAYFSWQVAVVALLAFVAFSSTASISIKRVPNTPAIKKQPFIVNPYSGLVMKNKHFDIAGNGFFIL